MDLDNFQIRVHQEAQEQGKAPNVSWSLASLDITTSPRAISSGLKNCENCKTKQKLGNLSFITTPPLAISLGLKTVKIVKTFLANCQLSHLSSSDLLRREVLTGTEDVSKNVQIFKAMEKGTLVPDVSNIISWCEGKVKESLAS